MSKSKPDNNPILSIAGVIELAETTGEFYLIKCRVPENSTMYVLQPVDFAPLGPYVINKIYGKGVDTFICVDQLSCDMRIFDFFRKFGGLFETPEDIQDYELRLKCLKSHKQEYLEWLDEINCRGKQALTEAKLPQEIQVAMKEKKGQKLQ
ncbi:MAG: hypothetical protein RLZZ76_131 [Candidatus Parcubacteria bacterium]